VTRPRRGRKRSVDRDPELVDALGTGTPCAYSLERWCRITSAIYFGEEPDLPLTYADALLDQWWPEYKVDGVRGK
jgi:hypothetical protein